MLFIILLQDFSNDFQVVVLNHNHKFILKRFNSISFRRKINYEISKFYVMLTE